MFTRRFVFAYVKSMRLYFAFITGIAGWLGVAFYGFCMPEHAQYLRGAIILFMLFMTYGINQVINDFFGQAEDRINAPNRPMVTGDLPPRAALWISILLMTAVLCGSWFLNPWSTIPVIAGVLLNLLYEFAKSWSLIGNLVFGCSIAMCTAYGFLASGPLPTPVFTKNRVSVFLLVTLLNALMTYYTYFKDYHGDLRTGKRTFVVKYGLQTARYAGVFAAFLPTLAFFALHFTGWLPISDILFQRDFIFCGVVTLFLQLWTAILYFTNPVGTQTYYNLVTNIRACVAGQITLIAIFNGTLALYLLTASYVLIGFLFDLHKDARS